MNVFMVMRFGKLWLFRLLERHILTNASGMFDCKLVHTPRKINKERENDGLEDDFPFPGTHSQVPC